MYKLYGQYVIRLFDNAYIPKFESNSEYQQYLQWLAAGNTPKPQGELPTFPTSVSSVPSLEDRVEAAETLINLILLEGE